MRFFPEDLRNEAKAIASSGKGAMQVWAELKQWAGKRGPLAMKSAMMEFLGQYGGTPEAAYVMPELMRNASSVFTPSERGELVRLSMRRNTLADSRASLKSLSPKTAFNPSERSLALNFRPNTREGAAPRLGVIEPVSPRADHAYMRDMPIHARERLESAMLSPQSRLMGAHSPGMGERSGRFDFDPHKSPDSRAISAQKGENIVRSLIHSVRSHGRDEMAHLSPAVAPKRKAAKKAARVSKPAKAAKKRHARAPARKAQKVRVVSRKTRGKVRVSRAKASLNRQKRRKK